MKSVIRFICCFIPIKKVRSKVRDNLFYKVNVLKKYISCFLPFKEHYDFIVSIGNECQVSYQLRRLGFQKRSYPFDWLCSQKKINWFDFILNDFDDFLEKENMEKCDVNSFDYMHDQYKNTKTSLLFIHDFDSRLSLDQTFPKVQEKYSRRIARLQENIEKSRKILFVFKNDKLSKMEVLNTYRKLLSKFPKQEIDLLWIVKNENTEDITYNCLSPHIKQVLFDCDFYDGKDQEKNRWVGNTKLYDQLFKGITFSYKGLQNNLKKQN